MSKRPAEPLQPHPKGRVLLVDDERAILKSFGRILRGAGFAVEEVSDGRLVGGVLERGGFDLVMTDLNMPWMGGIEILQAVRKLDPDLPVVLITGGGDLATAMKAVEYGALRYLMKPVEAPVLIKIAEDGVALRQTGYATRRALHHYDHVAGQQSSVRAELTTRFEGALKTLHMVYQPVVRWSDRCLFGYEALVRTEEHSLSHPHELFAAAQALDRLHEVGRAVRGKVAQTLGLASMPDTVFVNLHARDLEDDELLSITSPLSGVATRIVLEVTERTSLETTSAMRERLHELRTLGYRLAVDDLGSAYSGLASLVQLHPDVVKLDMSLTRGVDVDPTKGKLIQTVAAFCRDLGWLVIAEGVETLAERDALVSLGCDLLQGYLIGKPARAIPTTYELCPPQ